MPLQLGSAAATLALGATPVSRVYRDGRLDFLRATLGGSDYIISGILYRDQGNAANAPNVPLLTASPWYDDDEIADEMAAILLALAATPFPGVPTATPNLVSGIAVGPIVRVGGPVETALGSGLDFISTGKARFYRADTGVVFSSTTYSSALVDSWHLVGRSA